MKRNLAKPPAYMSHEDYDWLKEHGFKVEYGLLSIGVHGAWSLNETMGRVTAVYTVTYHRAHGLIMHVQMKDTRTPQEDERWSFPVVRKHVMDGYAHACVLVKTAAKWYDKGQRAGALKQSVGAFSADEREYVETRGGSIVERAYIPLVKRVSMRVTGIEIEAGPMYSARLVQNHVVLAAGIAPTMKGALDHMGKVYVDRHMDSVDAVSAVKLVDQQ